MKAYQMRIEFKGSKPCIWRRILISADASFRELHEVIQTIFNFQDSHLYIFHLLDHKLKVTNDEEAHQVYEEYLENQGAIEKTLLALDTPFAKRQLENLRTVVGEPDAFKIEPYLQESVVIDYLYDFGDNWEISLTVERIVEDYTLDYPTLLAGEQGAPLENMGGLAGFEEFLEAYNDPQHLDHAAAQAWGHQQGFTEYDGESIEGRLKSLGKDFKDQPTRYRVEGMEKC